MKIEIIDRLKLEDKYLELIKKAVNTVLDIEKIYKDGELSLLITDDKEIRKLNKKYRGIDKSTDVLSFYNYTSVDELTEEEYITLGDIVINYNKVIEQSKEYNTGLKHELMYLTIHSMYHLFGYNHIDEDDKLLMREKEKNAMKKLYEENIL